MPSGGHGRALLIPECMHFLRFSVWCFSHARTHACMHLDSCVMHLRRLGGMVSRLAQACKRSARFNMMRILQRALQFFASRLKTLVVRDRGSWSKACALTTHVSALQHPRVLLFVGALSRHLWGGGHGRGSCRGRTHCYGRPQHIVASGWLWKFGLGGTSHVHVSVALVFRVGADIAVKTCMSPIDSGIVLSSSECKARVDLGSLARAPFHRRGVDITRLDVALLLHL